MLLTYRNATRTTTTGSISNFLTRMSGYCVIDVKYMQNNLEFRVWYVMETHRRNAQKNGFDFQGQILVYAEQDIQKRG